LSRRGLLTATFIVGALAWLLASPASADGPTVPPSASPAPPTGTATPTPPPGLTTWQTPAPIPTPRATSSPQATPTPSASASPSASPSPEPSIDPAEARARDAALLANAKSLAQIIDAQARVSQDELAALVDQVTQVREDLDVVNADIAALQARSAKRGSLHDSLARDAFRLAALSASPAPAAISEAQRDALDELRSLEASLAAAQARLTDRAAVLTQLTESVGAKQGQLARLRDRARVLAAAAVGSDTEARAAQVAVLQALARDAAAAQTSLAQLVAAAMVPDGTTTSSWSLPLRGPITQAFGPTALALEPARTYRGASYEHFHDAIDIAARLGSPVAAAADGQVTFVGHLPDGAMIVLIAHAGGFVSEYAHLDDTFVLPPVRAGQTVKAGQTIGFVGLTGITTGPHLHFALIRSGEAVDPLTLIGQ
jgi:murein DD-endopeptidase MepM/ murein hydrolase activator NlpD